MKVYITYGIGSNLSNCYSVVYGKNLETCMKRINRVTGGMYAFSYCEEDFKKIEEKYGPMIQVSLQPHVITRGE
ncbi:MAG: hypothetical protein [Podoviridae sp. ctQNx1]|nr:MAG: hypothetical protein [Podoviridae sp. ctQNx1]UOF78125.1 hypothetical protein [Caudoviricetes sp.]